MRFIRAEITEFGKLKNRIFDFEDGMNIIEGDNETGKSTLLAFIKYMLYGLNPKRASNEEPSERERYLSWDGKRASGSLVFESDTEEKWKIEREARISVRDKKEEFVETPVKLVNLETMLPFKSEKEPGEYFLGINSEVFAGTAFIAQLSGRNINGEQIGNCIENMLQTADENINVKKAIKKLDDARKELIYKNKKGGLIYDLRRETERKEGELADAEGYAEKIRILGKKRSSIEEELKSLQSEQARLSEIWNKSEGWLCLRRFEELRKTEKELKETEERLSLLEKDSFPLSFVPDGDFVIDLKKRKDEIESLDSKLEKFAARHRYYAQNPTFDGKKAQIAEKIDDKAKISNDFSLISKSAKAGKGLCIALFSVAAAAALACVLSIKSGTKVFFPLLAVAFLSLISAFAAAVHASGAKRKLRRFLGGFGVSEKIGSAEFNALLESCLAAKESKTLYAENLKSCKDGAEDALSEISAKANEIRENLLKLGANVEISSFGGDATETYEETDEAVTVVCSEIDKAVEICDKFIHKRSAYAETAKNQRTIRADLAEILKNQDEAFIRAKVAGFDPAEVTGYEEYQRKRKELRNLIAEKDEEKTSLDQTIMRYEALAVSPAKIRTEIDKKKDEIESLQLKADALVLAGEALEKASAELRRGFTPELKRKASEILRPLTSGAHETLNVAHDFSLSAVMGGLDRSSAFMSGGTKDAAYLSLRLALAVMICEKEKPVMMFDEALSQLDAKRAKNLLDILSEYCENGYQCLLFTCHDREAKLAGKFKHIRI